MKNSVLRALGWGTALCMLALVILCARSIAAIPTGAWGLHFSEDGRAPTGNAPKQALAKYDAVYLGDEGRKRIYLTFDAGYENGATEAILDALAKHHAPAAFFLVGNYLEQNPALVQRMSNEGHIVGNHTWHHYDMSKIADRATFEQELSSVEAAYEQAVGSPMPKYYRPPQGVYSEENLQMAQQLGYRTVFWSLAYRDWLQDDQPEAEEAFSKLIGRIHNGAVLLLHATSSTNAAILDELLTKYEQMWYRFGTLDELFEGSGVPDPAL
jgi:peptidoglycan-N-acetylmuramic acid deacetylase